MFNFIIVYSVSIEDEMWMDYDYHINTNELSDWFGSNHNTTNSKATARNEVSKKIHYKRNEKVVFSPKACKTNNKIPMPEGCRLHVKKFDQLRPNELYALLQIRSEVFVVEQNCVYQDLDNNDLSALHLWITKNNKIVAMCRVCAANTYLSEVSIGRVISTERGKGYGKVIVKAAIETAITRNKKLTCIDINAQIEKQMFYEKLGFISISEPFLIDEQQHIHMRYIVSK